MSREFEVIREVDLRAAPDDVWTAITADPAAWMFPTGMEIPAGAAPPEGAPVTTWDPPRRLGIRMESPDGTFNALDYAIEARDGGMAHLRYVHSGILADGWEDQYDAIDGHTDFYLHTLGQYLEHFKGRQVTYVGQPSSGIEGPETAGTPDAMDALRAALGVYPDAGVGDAVHASVGDAGTLAGVVDYSTPEFLGVRTADGLYRLQRAGASAFLAEPAETSARRGPKRRAKTDKRDARHLRDLLLERRLPRAWIPPEHILELRALVRLRKTLVDQRTEWLQRIHAVLFHHGVKLAVSRLDGRDAREQLAALNVAPSACQQIDVALAIVEHVNAQLAPLDRELKAFARRQPGCRALMRHYGIGPQVACAILAELGDARRFSSSRQAVRFAGLDVTVHESDDKRRPGHLSRQGPPVLRWAAFEAAESACKPSSPDHAYYLQLKERVGQNRAVLSIARKLLRRAHHTLRELGDDALAPAA